MKLTGAEREALGNWWWTAHNDDNEIGLQVEVERILEQRTSRYRLAWHSARNRADAWKRLAKGEDK